MDHTCPVCGVTPGSTCRRKRGFRMDPKSHRHREWELVGIPMPAGTYTGNAPAASGNPPTSPPSLGAAGALQSEIVVDGSMLSAVAKCSTQAAIRYVWDMESTTEKWAALAGTAAHSAMQVHLQGGSFEAALAAFDKDYCPPEEVISAPGFEPRLAPESCRRILDHWFRHHPLANLPFSVEATEQRFKLPLGLTQNGTLAWFCGRWDAVLRPSAPEGQYLRIADLKTTGKLTEWWSNQWLDSAQLTGYCWTAMNGALPAHLLGSQVIGATVIAIEFRVIPSSDTKCRDGHGVPYSECGILHCKDEIIHVTRTPEQLEEWRLSALHLAQRFADLCQRFPTFQDGIHRVRMQGMFNGSCTFCGFKSFCRSNRPLGLLAQHLYPNRWEPFEGARKV